MMTIRWAVFMVLMLSVDDVSAWKNKRLKNIIHDMNNWQISGHSGVIKTIKETVLDKLSKVKSKKDFKKDKLCNIPMTMSRDVTNVESGKQPECEPSLGPYTIPNIDGMLMKPRYLHNVRRCGGGCCTDEWKECVVVTQTNKSVNVSIFKSSDLAKTFRNQTVYYTDHDTCTCQCKVRPSDCTSNQSYNEKSCECECNGKGNSTCSSPHTWSKNRCKCVCSSGPKDCDKPNMVWNEDTCSCSCKKYDCPVGQQQNQNNCLCD